MKADRRCTARSKRSQRRCRKAAIVGGHVCHFHSGGAPQVKASARERIAALAEGPAIRALKNALTCGDWGATVRAAKDLLDRAGITAHSYSVEEVEKRLTAVARIILTNVSNPSERATIARELRMESMRFSDHATADAIAAVPAATAPPSTDLPPAAPPEPMEIEL